jgi:hypothetical protein
VSSQAIKILKPAFLRLYGTVNIVVDAYIVEDFYKTMRYFFKKNRLDARYKSIQYDKKMCTNLIFSWSVERTLVEDLLELLKKRFFVWIIDLGTHEIILVAHKSLETPLIGIDRRGITINNIIGQYEPAVKKLYGEIEDDGN